MKKIQAQQLYNEIIEPNYCSGCGVCTLTKDSPFRMKLNKYGQYIPMANIVNNAHVVCPFADHGINETDIGKDLFDSQQINFHPEFGYYLGIYASKVLTGNYRKKGSSGGAVSWFADKLLQKGMVDYIVHVKEQKNSDVRYKYEISSSPDENKKGAKSKYYPVSLEEVLLHIKENDGKYAIIGVPCFIKGIHLLKKEEKIFKERIPYTISIFCGHLKTTHYLSSLISQFDVKEKEVTHFDFRHKIPGKKASDYASKLILKDGSEKIKMNKELFGTNWGWGLFKLKACDYCDDIIGETADISFGDAWIPKYENDSMGTNIVVIRNKKFQQIWEEYSGKEIDSEPLSPDDLIASQAGGFRHRREGLAYRLFFQQKKGNPVPEKRVTPQKIKSKKRRKLYEIRMKLQEVSFYTSNYQNILDLKKELGPWIKKMEKIYRHSAYTRFRLWVKNKF